MNSAGLNPLPTSVFHSSTRLTHAEAHTFLSTFLERSENDAAYRPDSTLTERGPVAVSSGSTPNLTLSHLKRILLGMEGKKSGGRSRLLDENEVEEQQEEEDEDVFEDAEEEIVVDDDDEAEVEEVEAADRDDDEEAENYADVDDQVQDGEHAPHPQASHSKKGKKRSYPADEEDVESTPQPKKKSTKRTSAPGMNPKANVREDRTEGPVLVLGTQENDESDWQDPETYALRYDGDTISRPVTPRTPTGKNKQRRELVERNEGRREDEDFENVAGESSAKRLTKDDEEQRALEAKESLSKDERKRLKKLRQKDTKREREESRIEKKAQKLVEEEGEEGEEAAELQAEVEAHPEAMAVDAEEGLKEKKKSKKKEKKAASEHQNEETSTATRDADAKEKKKKRRDKKAKGDE